MNEVDACRAVLIEVLTILAKDLDKLAVVGGWVPELAFPTRDISDRLMSISPSTPESSNPKPTSRSERSWRTLGISSPRICQIGSFVTSPTRRYR
jgi:hypothetical protein